MTGARGEDELLADVCRTLERAGFDLVAPGSDADGLRVCREADAVVVRWEPGSGPVAAHHAMDHESMRMALRHALTALLTQTGYAVRTDPASGAVQVRRVP
ncbi:hypothetical protein [Streptomyces collinus]|uniref:hypothetical protein n=1 Tax=Streptomyces collinus TaxID=42684 RepID=UPI002943C3E8|nr:hypothetical protein [Streptomyces collinus]